MYSAIKAIKNALKEKRKRKKQLNEGDYSKTIFDRDTGNRAYAWK